jgi:preprotein translocase subunit SecD
MIDLKVLKSGRVIFLMIILALALIALYPNPWNNGVAIRGVVKDGPANLAGIQSPKPASAPMTKEIITSINNVPISSIEEYAAVLKTLKVNTTTQLKTNKGIYRISPQYKFEYVTVENETTYENRTTQVYNQTLNMTVNVTALVKVAKRVKVVDNTSLDLGMSVFNAPKTNIRTGLDLQGGTRVLLEPAEQVTDEQFDNLLASLEERINVYGIGDVVIRPANDLVGKKYIRIEIAGVTEEEVREFITSQGKFESKIGNTTVFIGGNDITYVCKTSQCSGLSYREPCGRTSDNQWACRFMFSITVRPEAAQRQADTTRNLEVISTDGQEYLSQKIDFYLDDVLVDSLNIGADLKGRAATDIEISGSGAGITQQEAVNDALKNMKRLQTILITGSLPVKLNIVQIDTISPTLGKEFSRSTILLAILASIAVIIVIFIKYREIRIVFPIAVTLVSEIVIIIGVAALIGWNIDLAAIAGIIVAVGTGVDDQIVITDETLRGESQVLSWKERFKKAMFIIMAAYLTTIVSMVPLLAAGAGLLKGFAITSILGVSIGVFITRPANAAMIERILKEKKQ